MSKDTGLSCQCGKVTGRAQGVSAGTVNRVICYCEDCQAYIQHLKRPELLDEHGGSDIVQVAPCTLSFEQGTEHITGVRLTPKGLYRWYADCCNTPLGNTLGPALPFVGIGSKLFSEASSADELDQLLGSVRGRVFGKHAKGNAPAGATKFDLGLTLRSLRLVLGWKLRSRSWPHPFFDRSSKAPTYSVSVLSSDEREALRPYCGPNPTA